MPWMSLHVFEPEPLEPLLLDTVAGVSRGLKADRLVRRFFFLRYAEDGYHVRLRFDVPDALHEVAVRERVTTALRHYGQSKATMPAIVVAAYEPELGRYGGAAGVDIAETHFDFSSEMALRILERTRAHGTEAIPVRLGLALEASLALADGFGLARHSIGELFQGYLVSTAAAIALPDPRPVFSVAAARQADRLRQIGRSVFADPARRSRWAEAWRTHGFTLAGRLAARGVCEDPGRLTRMSGGLVSSYIHMFINRLGLFGAPEAYLCYLAVEVCGGTLAGVAAESGR